MTRQGWLKLATAFNERGIMLNNKGLDSLDLMIARLFVESANVILDADQRGAFAPDLKSLDPMKN